MNFKHIDVEGHANLRGSFRIILGINRLSLIQLNEGAEKKR